MKRKSNVLDRREWRIDKHRRVNESKHGYIAPVFPNRVKDRLALPKSGLYRRKREPNPLKRNNGGDNRPRKVTQDQTPGNFHWLWQEIKRWGQSMLAWPAYKWSCSGDEVLFSTRYSVGTLLGQGGFGKVFKGLRNSDGRKVAIKYVKRDGKNFDYIKIPGTLWLLPREVALMSLVCRAPTCDNVVQLIEWFELADWFVVVMEQPNPAVNLSDYVTHFTKGAVKETVAKGLVRQAVQATRHCSDRGVLHSDIKLENFLVNTETLQVKMIDFGVGKLLTKGLNKDIAGTTEYYPPEWLQNKQYVACHYNIWSLGMMIFKLVCARAPFNSEDDKVTSRKMPFRRGLSPDCKDLIKSCLAKEPSRRPHLDQVLEHCWMTNRWSNRLRSRCCCGILMREEALHA